MAIHSRRLPRDPNAPRPTLAELRARRAKERQAPPPPPSWLERWNPPKPNPVERPELTTAWKRSAVAVLLLLFASIAEHSLPPKPHDDAFITYRYAANLASGAGFVYNPGEYVLGTSTPLYTIILAAGNLVGLSIPWFSSMIEALAVVAIGALFLLYFNSMGRPWIGVAVAALFALQRRMLGFGMGMESWLFSATLLAAWVAARFGRMKLACALTGPATLLRPEGFLVLLPVGLALAYQWPLMKRRARREAVYALVLSMGAAFGWLFFAWIYFGTIIPQSVAGKMAQATRTALDRGFMEGIRDLYVYGYEGFRPLALVVWPGLIWGLARRREAHGIFLWLAAYILLFRTAPYYHWYMVPSNVAFWLATGYAADGAIRLVGQSSARRFAVPLAATLLLAGHLRELDMSVRLSVEYVVDPGSRAQDARYRDVSAWLIANTPEDAVVGSGEVGMIGFYSGRRMIDPFGLVTPRSLDFMRAGIYNLDVIVLRQWPDYVVRTEIVPGLPIDLNYGFRGVERNYEVMKRFEYFKGVSRDPLTGAKIHEPRHTIVMKRRAKPLPLEERARGPVPAATLYADGPPKIRR